jgi:glycosyltransferase involved in cell wall biosynthesis
MDLLEFHERPGRYLAFLGRVTPDKGLDRAIQIARRTDLPLRVAAKVDRADRDYFADVIKPMLVRAGSLVEFIGEIGDAEKSAFLGGALAVLFPIDWPEPFGLVMIESLACGTPVIAMRRGSVPEILEHGVSGFVVDDVESAVRAVGALPCLSRRGCRRAFEERFSARRMAQDYLAIYERLVGGEPTAQRPDSRGGAVAAPPVVASADHNGRPGRVLAR